MSRLICLPLAALCAVSLSACGNTIQASPIPHNLLEGLLLTPYPVYWAGGSFRGKPISEVAQDPSGAVRLQYGTCVQGGQSTCVTALRVVTSPNNSFTPGGAAAARTVPLRGVQATLGQGGDTIEIPTGGVIVSINAANPALAWAAAQTVVPINQAGAPFERLPARLPDTGFADRPLPSQVPRPLRQPSAGT